jgi:hypothetical protein
MGPLVASADRQLARKRALLLSSELAGNQGGGICGLQHARAADLVGRHLGEGDTCSWLHISHTTPAAMPGSKGGEELCLTPRRAAI